MNAGMNSTMTGLALFCRLIIVCTWLLQSRLCFDSYESSPASDQYLPLTIEEDRVLAVQPYCQILLTESIPINLTYTRGSPRFISTYFAWRLLLDVAKEDVNIASFYWSLLAEPKYNASSSDQGLEIFHTLLSKAAQLNLSIEQSGPQKADSHIDQLLTAGSTVYWVDVAGMLGQGVLHTKLWTVDQRHAYVGSANMDWRSLTQVKELGALMLNCPELVNDLDKIHGAYRLASKGLPKYWPPELTTKYNVSNPFQLAVNGVKSRVYFSGSPTNFNAPGRTNDLDAILNTINRATKFVYISVMDYIPEIRKYDNSTTGQYWPDIDVALKLAAVDRGVEIRLLISHWKHSSSNMPKHLISLRSLNGVHGARIRIRYFVVPSVTKDQQSIPFARVNHNKYMVTDKTAYIGTSNWSGDYFLYTGGVGFVYEKEDESHETAKNESEPHTVRDYLEEIFLRDWNSEHAYEEWD